MTKPTLFQALHFIDADAGVAFLTAIGFREVVLVRADDDPTVIEHAELVWRDGGGLMCGSASRPVPDGADYVRRTGTADTYLVVATDADVDAVYSRAVAAGARTLIPVADQDYGGRSVTIADLEGNQFSIGSYPGA